MMNLIARSNERAPSALYSTASEIPGETRHESQNLLSPQAEKYDRTERPAVCSEGHSSSYIECDVDEIWSSQEWKSDELMDDRSGKPVVCSQRLKHVSLVNARTSLWKKNQITIERGDPLFAHSERINSLLKTTRQNQNCL